jgi:hypothetical protein
VEQRSTAALNTRILKGSLMDTTAEYQQYLRHLATQLKTAWDNAAIVEAIRANEPDLARLLDALSVHLDFLNGVDHE